MSPPDAPVKSWPFPIAGRPPMVPATSVPLYALAASPSCAVESVPPPAYATVIFDAVPKFEPVSTSSFPLFEATIESVTVIVSGVPSSAYVPLNPTPEMPGDVARALMSIAYVPGTDASVDVQYDTLPFVAVPPVPKSAFTSAKFFDRAVLKASLSRSASESDRVVATDDRAFDAFFTTHQHRLFTAMCLVTRDRSEAEDITQEAFVQVLERWDRVSVMDDSEGLVAIRRTLRPAPRPDPIAEVDTRDAAIRALATLSDRQRAAIVLTDLLGYSSEEAGRILAIRASTVRAHVSIARAALRSTMSEDR